MRVMTQCIMVLLLVEDFNMQLKMLVDGGDMKPGPTVGQQLGPVGLNIGQVIQKVNEVTKGFKGMKVPITLDINTKTKGFDVLVSSPPTSELLKKEIGVEKGSGKAKDIKVGNISMEQIITVSKIKNPNMITSSFKNTVKSVVGSCISLGIIIDNKAPQEITSDIDSGIYDKIINEQITEVSDDKKKSLMEHFKNVKEQQDKILQKEAEKKSEEEAKKAAEAPVAAAAPASTPAGKATAAPAKAAAKAPAKGKK